MSAKWADELQKRETFEHQSEAVTPGRMIPERDIDASPNVNSTINNHEENHCDFTDLNINIHEHEEGEIDQVQNKLKVFLE